MVTVIHSKDFNVSPKYPFDPTIYQLKHQRSLTSSPVPTQPLQQGEPWEERMRSSGEATAGLCAASARASNCGACSSSRRTRR